MNVLLEKLDKKKLVIRAMIQTYTRNMMERKSVVQHAISFIVAFFLDAAAPLFIPFTVSVR